MDTFLTLFGLLAGRLEIDFQEIYLPQDKYEANVDMPEYLSFPVSPPCPKAALMSKSFSNIDAANYTNPADEITVNWCLISSAGWQQAYHIPINVFNHTGGFYSAISMAMIDRANCAILLKAKAGPNTYPRQYPAMSFKLILFR